MKSFCCITTFFNPARFKSLLKNYFVFAEQLRRQNVNLLTIELAFNGEDFEIPESDNVRRLRSNSVLWQKERLINYGISQLPDGCECFAWLDCDVVFPDGWEKIAIEKLEKNQIIQLFKKVICLPKGHLSYQGEREMMFQGIAWQKAIHRNWLERRKSKELPFSHPGFAWAAQRDVFPNGIYDKNIIGSGDTFMVDTYFNSWDIHGYAKKFNDHMKNDMMVWSNEFNKKNISIGYAPLDIVHLWHGSFKNRNYMDRHEAITKYDYDPNKDIKLVDNVYEWASDKTELHDFIKQYFYDRLEDDL